MKKLRIKEIPTVRTSLTLAGIFAVMILMVPIVSAIGYLLFGGEGHQLSPSPIKFMVRVTGGYFLFTYLFVLFFCLIYNFIAKRTGGIEIVVEEEEKS